MSINVVVADRAEEQAYELGYERFEAFENSADEQTELDLSAFTSSSEYANEVLPALRALAGRDDAGHGTYQVGGEIVIVDAANLEDDPITGDRRTTEEYVSVLVDRWHDGARDAFDADAEKGDSL